MNQSLEQRMLNRRRFLVQAGKSLAALYLTGCGASTNAVKIKDSNFYENSLPNFSVDEIVIGNRAYIGIELPKDKKVKIGNTTYSRKVVADTQLIPFDNHRTVIENGRPVINAKGEQYFLVNLKRKNNALTLNNTEKPDRRLVTVSKRNYDVILEDKIQGPARTKKMKYPKNGKLNRICLNGIQYIHIPTENLNLGNVASLPVILMLDDNIEEELKIDRNPNGVKTKFGLKGFAYVPIRGELINAP